MQIELDKVLQCSSGQAVTGLSICSCRGVSITDSAVVDLGTYHVEVFLSTGANANFDCSIFLEIVNCDLVVLFQTQPLGGAKVFDNVCLVVPTFIISRKGAALTPFDTGKVASHLYDIFKS